MDVITGELYCGVCVKLFVIHETPAWRWPTSGFFSTNRRWKLNWNAEKPATTMTCRFHSHFYLWLNNIFFYYIEKAQFFFFFFISKPKREVFEERISSYRKALQSFKEYYHQSPLAQKLLTLQAENEKIESRIKAWDDQIMTKQKELEHLTGNTFLFHYSVFW